MDTAAQRLATADPVAAFKWINGGPITDPQRADQVLDAVGSDATAHGIDQKYVRMVFTDQIDATEGMEYRRFGRWKFDPSTAPTTAPDLSDSRSDIDGLKQDDGRRDCAAMEFTTQPHVFRRATRGDGRRRSRPPTGSAVPTGPVVGHPVLLPTHLSRRESRRSASTLPPVWQVGQYWKDLSANDTSRTVSPHTGHGSPVRACTRSPERFSPFNVAAC